MNDTAYCKQCQALHSFGLGMGSGAWIEESFPHANPPTMLVHVRLSCGHGVYIATVIREEVA